MIALLTASSAGILHLGQQGLNFTLDACVCGKKIVSAMSRPDLTYYMDMATLDSMATVLATETHLPWMWFGF